MEIGSCEKKNFDQNLGTLKISLLPRKTAKNGQTSEVQEKVQKTLPGTLPTTFAIYKIIQNIFFFW